MQKAEEIPFQPIELSRAWVANGSKMRQGDDSTRPSTATVSPRVLARWIKILECAVYFSEVSMFLKIFSNTQMDLANANGWTDCFVSDLPMCLMIGVLQSPL